MTNDIKFKKELKALLEKYNASIDIENYTECSCGAVYDEKLVVYFNDTREEFELSNDSSIKASDLLIN